MSNLMMPGRCQIDTCSPEPEQEGHAKANPGFVEEWCVCSLQGFLFKLKGVNFGTKVNIYLALQKKSNRIKNLR